MPSAAASRVGVNLRASAYLHQGDRKYMEDEFQVAYQRTHDKKDIEYAFFGIFDGHGGKEAAHFAKDNLMDNIVSLRAFWSDDDEDVLAAIKEGFLQTHMAMWKELDQWPRTASGWPSTSGTTASVAFIRRQKIYIGHVGDSGIVLGYEDDRGMWHGEALTQDHKPESVVEKARITECGGKVINKSGVPRVVWNRPKSGHQGPVRRSTPMDEIPFLAVARSLGDLWSYNATNDQFVVSPEPDVCVLPVDISRHRCLIFGTDGLWNVLTPDAAVTVAHQAEKNNEKHYLGVPNSSGKQRLWVNPSRSVVSGALGRYLKLNLRADNTSAVTVFLDPPGRPKREVLLQQKGLNSKKPSPAKTTVKLGQPAAEETNKDALVQVHLYNQNQGTKSEANRRLIHIKERLPERWQMKDEGEREGEPGGGGTDTGQDDGGAGGAGDYESDSPPPEKEGCAECGCPMPGTSGTDDETPLATPPSETDVAEPKESPSSRLQIVPENTLVDEVENNPESRQTEPVGDDIQIPVVSSSTISPRTDVRGRKGRAGGGGVGPDTLPHIKGDVRRRTRSNVSVPHPAEIENSVLNPNNNNEWKDDGKEERGPGTSAKTKAVEAPETSPVSPTNRVLKSVNRGATEGHHSAAKTITPKRKRTTEGDGEASEPSVKSAKVHTRSHTWSHKPMITRSQERSYKTPSRACATPRK